MGKVAGSLNTFIGFAEPAPNGIKDASLRDLRDGLPGV